ncbi:MAG: imidazolonepropionase [Pseudomonadota bacterium]
MLFINATLATMDRATPYGLTRDAALVINKGRIAWIGINIPAEYRNEQRIDLEGRLITPGLIDCHTHLVHGGNRAAEFEKRLQGATYEEVARSGGGILSTVAATRAASEADLLASALIRLDALIAEGVTTVEVKSGYGLDVETELKMLRVARALGRERLVRVRTSFLGAHAIPPEFKNSRDAYLTDMCLPALQAAHAEGLVDAVDGFCEGIAFNADEIASVFAVSKSLDLPVKLHAAQLSDMGAVGVATRFGALSADHLEYATKADVGAMAEAGTVAVLLPGAYYTLRQKQKPPVDAFSAHDVPIAVATDCNPGSSPLTSILMAMNMACTLFQLTPEEALRGATDHAARALGLADLGRLAVGMHADLAIWDVEHPSELAYRIGFNPLYQRWFAGELTP